MICPCGSAVEFSQCCEPLHLGQRRAERAEELMRARYSAYATQAIDFIIDTHDPHSREETDRASLEAWSKESEWKGLEILSKEAGESGDKTGVVEFIAHFAQNGKNHAHHERAEFSKRDGHWFFVDGKMVVRPITREGAKVGRNDECPCGSGKKYKKCCLLNVS
jgi:SEC-C motif domain protein